jgi:hypothetical protein
MVHSTRRRVFTATATALIAAGITFAGTNTTAHATTGQMRVTSATAPVWLSNEAVPVAVVANNPNSNFLCNPIVVKLVWFSAGGHKHFAYRSGPAATGTYTGTIRIPARTVWPGTLHYRVIAYQTCGLMVEHVDRYRAVSPSSGWAHATIK